MFRSCRRRRWPPACRAGKGEASGLGLLQHAADDGVNGAVTGTALTQRGLVADADQMNVLFAFDANADFELPVRRLVVENARVRKSDIAGDAREVYANGVVCHGECVFYCTYSKSNN